MEALLKIGGTIAGTAGKMFLDSRREKAMRETSLLGLAKVRGLGLIPQQRFDRQMQQLSETIAERLDVFTAVRYPDMPVNEQQSALDAVADTLVAAELSDRLLLGANVSAAEVMRVLEKPARKVLAGAGLTERSTEYFKVMLDEVVAHLIEIVVSLPSFQGRALRELLERDSTIIDFLREVLSRMPRHGVLGGRPSEDVQVDYLRELARKLDQVEIFGVTFAHPTRRLSLSVSYIGLTVRVEPRNQVRQRVLDAVGDAVVVASCSEQDVQQVLAGNPLLIVRGEAGSGKTTLLQWLAVNTARRTLGKQLEHWNGLVPFFIQLRRFAGKDLPDPEHLNAGIGWQVLADKPVGWISDVLRTGRALILIDGVDELPDERRAGAVEWVGDLVASYPGCKFVITSRPPALSDDWLADIAIVDEEHDLRRHVSFTLADLQPMTPNHLRMFVRHWHDAAGLDAGRDELVELDDLRRRLVAAIEANAPLRGLATNPLLCALLCALNRDRRSQLPHSRIELYRTALEMLLSRRDTDRSVQDPLSSVLSTDDKLQLLAHIAFWFTENNFVTVTRDRVIDLIGRSLSSYPGRHLEPHKVYKHLLLRTGVLREPVVGRVDFLHKSFQEFLCARWIVDNDLIDMLKSKFDKRSFHEVVIMAAGQARPREQSRLLQNLVDRISTTEHERELSNLRLLLLRCLETAKRPDPDVYDLALDEIQEIIPPRTMEEAKALAVSGTDALRFLPVNDLSPTEVSACIRTAGLVSGPEALDYLTQLASAFPDARTRQDLIGVWPFFDPVTFARRIFHDAPIDDTTLIISEPAILPGIADTLFTSVKCEFNETATQADLAAATRLPALISLSLVDCPQFDNLDFITDELAINEFSAQGCPEIRDLSPLARLRHLTDLDLVDLAPTIDYLPVAGARNLTSLRVGPIDLATAAALISDLPQLQSLELLSCHGLTKVADLGKNPNIAKIVLDDGYALAAVGDLTTLPAVTELRIQECPIFTSLENSCWSSVTALAIHWCDNFTSLVGAEGLAELSLVGLRNLTDLRPLAGLRSLRRLRITHCEGVRDLSVLAELPNLRTVDLYSAPQHRVQGLIKAQPKLAITDRSPSRAFLPYDLPT